MYFNALWAFLHNGIHANMKIHQVWCAHNLAHHITRAKEIPERTMHPTKHHKGNTMHHKGIYAFPKQDT